MVTVLSPSRIPSQRDYIKMALMSGFLIQEDNKAMHQLQESKVTGISLSLTLLSISKLTLIEL